MKPTLTAIVFAIALSAGTQSANAQFRYDSATSFDLADYAVYFANPSVNGWYIQWLDDDGNVVREDGPYNTEDNAWDRVYWHYFGGHEPTNNARVVYTSRQGHWQHFETYDTFEEALMWADAIESLGLLADIRRIEKFEFPVFEIVEPRHPGVLVAAMGLKPRSWWIYCIAWGQVSPQL